ncbi:hypothetical protein PRIPAC_73853 [Pristionchus pacificus]|uniref:Uncharacterized protein n=1 Tax=Pristionchus pacificus TaxID=54126 RepID=A0A2A6BFQ3_PRIPA|nr:hypothetical protein PRIPAC_73853 [Pristionchus pacificus]|eukprot:PDM64693.1 hypothetical protein PRIPAC_52949 [Pristionchus pacificus]
MLFFDRSFLAALPFSVKGNLPCSEEMLKKDDGQIGSFLAALPFSVKGNLSCSEEMLKKDDGQDGSFLAALPFSVKGNLPCSEEMLKKDDGQDGSFLAALLFSVKGNLPCSEEMLKREKRDDAPSSSRLLFLRPLPLDPTLTVTFSSIRRPRKVSWCTWIAEQESEPTNLVWGLGREWEKEDGGGPINSREKGD